MPFCTDRFFVQVEYRKVLLEVKKRIIQIHKILNWNSCIIFSSVPGDTGKSTGKTISLLNFGFYSKIVIATVMRRCMNSSTEE